MDLLIKDSLHQLEIDLSFVTHCREVLKVRKAIGMIDSYRLIVSKNKNGLVSLVQWLC